MGRGELPTIEQLVTWLQEGGVPIFDGDIKADNVRHTQLIFTRVDAFSALNAVRSYFQQNSYQLEMQSANATTPATAEEENSKDTFDTADEESDAENKITEDKAEKEASTIATVSEGPSSATETEESNQQSTYREAADLLWAAQARMAFRVSGADRTVAVLDTGLHGEHVDFAGRVTAQVNFTSDNESDQSNTDDGNGHGTNIAGIILANGKHTGVAPNAQIVPLKVLPNNGGGDFPRSIRRSNGSLSITMSITFRWFVCRLVTAAITQAIISLCTKRCGMVSAKRFSNWQQIV